MNYLAYHDIDDIIRRQQWQCFIQDILLGRRKCLLSPKIFTSLHIIIYIGGGGGGVFTYILDKLCKARSVLLGGLWEKKIAFVLVVVPVVFHNRPHTIHILLFMHNAYCALETQL